MRKRQHPSRQILRAHQPSDAVSVLAIAATAAILVLSLFAMERFAGVPVSVRGEAIYPEQQLKPKVKKTANKTSKAAERRAARTQRAVNIAPSGSTNTGTACSDANCSNLVSSLLSGSPECMRYQQCVDAVYGIIASQSCNSYASCRMLSAMYGFYYANRSCVYDFSAACAAALETAKKSVR